MADETLTLRPEVQRFAAAMERELRANDHKGGWRNDAPGRLLRRLWQEADELARALDAHKTDPSAETSARVASEAADVGNFAMMIADVCGGLR